MKVAISLIDSNPFRDMTANPIKDSKVEMLMESINDTDFWDNLVLRIHPDSKGRYQLAYGHHRLAALVKLDWTDIDVPVKEITDESMLKMMAAENRDEWGSSILVMLETARQVRDTLNGQARECETYDEYSSKFSFLKSQADFGNARKQGIGYRKVRDFLGKTWPENDIKYAFSALNAMDAGILEMSNIQSIKTSGMLNRFTSMVKQIRDMETIPLYLKDLWLDDLQIRIDDPENAPSVKLMLSVRNILNKGCDPVKYFESGRHANVNVVQVLVDLMEGGKIDTIAEGFEGFDEDIAEATEKVAERKKRAAAADAAGDEGEVVDTEEPTDSELADEEAAAADLMNVLPDDDIEDGDLGDVTDLDVGTPDVSIERLMNVFTKTAPTFAIQAKKLFGNISDSDDDKFHEAVTESFKHCTILVLELFGKDDALAMVKEVEAEYLKS